MNFTYYKATPLQWLCGSNGFSPEYLDPDPNLFLYIQSYNFTEKFLISEICTKRLIHETKSSIYGFVL
jgi:hypothetical protein